MRSRDFLVVSDPSFNERREPMLIKKNGLCVFFAASLIFFIKPVLAENPNSSDKPWKKFFNITGLLLYVKMFFKNLYSIATSFQH